MAHYTVEPKSRKHLREFAKLFRHHFGLDNAIRIPIVHLLDILSEKFESFNYEVVDDSELPKAIHAETNIITGVIRIKESVYNRACDGEGRDRMTIAHEIGHWFTLCYCGFTLQRSFDKNIPSYMDPEWQAKCFGGEFMISFDLTESMTAEEIAHKCGVSEDAARIQLKAFEKDR